MGKKMSHKRPSDDRKVFLVHSPGNHFTCYRKTSLKPPLQRPGLLLLENHGRAVVGAPKINPELGKPPVSHGPSHSQQSIFLKTTDYPRTQTKMIPTDTAQKSCESYPGTKTKIPGLDLTSKEKKVRDSTLCVPEVLPEKLETPTWKRDQGRGFLKKKQNKMKEEQDEKVWNEFVAMIKEKEDFPNWEIVKRTPNKTQKAQNDGQKPMESMNEGEEQEQDEDEDEKKEWNESIKNMKTMKTPNKFQREEEEEAWNELLDMGKEMKVEEIVKRRPKRTLRKKVSYQIM